MLFVGDLFGGGLWFDVELTLLGDEDDLNDIHVKSGKKEEGTGKKKVVVGFVDTARANGAGSNVGVDGSIVSEGVGKRKAEEPLVEKTDKKRSRIGEAEGFAIPVIPARVDSTVRKPTIPAKRGGDELERLGKRVKV